MPCTKEEFLNGGLAEEMFTGMLDEEYAKVMAKSKSTGIADVLYQQLSRIHGTAENPAESLPVETPGGAAVESQMRRLELAIATANRAAAEAAAQHAATIGHIP